MIFSGSGSYIEEIKMEKETLHVKKNDLVMVISEKTREKRKVLSVLSKQKPGHSGTKKFIKRHTAPAASKDRGALSRREDDQMFPCDAVCTTL
jgi:hypothetical protein